VAARVGYRGCETSNDAPYFEIQASGENRLRYRPPSHRLLKDLRQQDYTLRIHRYMIRIQKIYGIFLLVPWTQWMALLGRFVGSAPRIAFASPWAGFAKPRQANTVYCSRLHGTAIYERTGSTPSFQPEIWYFEGPAATCNKAKCGSTQSHCEHAMSCAETEVLSSPRTIVSALNHATDTVNELRPHPLNLILPRLDTTNQACHLPCIRYAKE
jgi:hypothetical protein